MSERRIVVMFREQQGRCHWCGVEMLPPGSLEVAKGQPVPPQLATVDHLRDRLAEFLCERVSSSAKVAACYRCNTARGSVRSTLITRRVIRTTGVPA